jgi:branched-chain amino acid transport system substrate-binding protein
MITLTAAGCHQSQAFENGESASYAIVGLSQITNDGAPVSADTAAAPTNPAGDGNATCPPVAIAAVTPITGADSSLGANVEDGAQLAADEHNAANPDCQVSLKVFDSEDDPQIATEVAPQVVDDASVIGVIGPTFSGETKATGAVFD